MLRSMRYVESPMRVIDETNLETCFDGTSVVKYFFDAPWTDVDIRTLALLGELRYYESFPRPMFHVQCPDGSVIKGVLGKSECRVIFARGAPDEAKRRFGAHFVPGLSEQTKEQ